MTTAKTSRPRTRPTGIIETDDDLRRGIRSLRRKCPVMRKVHDATGLPPLRRRAPGFEGLARIVVGQQLSVASAGAIWERCAKTIVPMGPDALQKVPDDDLRGIGLSRSKVKTLRAIASAMIDDDLDLEAMAGHDDEVVRASLVAIPGIGPWTADVFTLFCLGRADGFAPGDLALQVAAQHAFGREERPSAGQLHDLAEAWRPWRGVSARLLWAYYRVIRDGRSGIGV